MNTYEAMFIFDGSLEEDALAKVVDRIKGEITKLNGAIDKSDPMGKRLFARPIKKRESGQYIKMSFQLAPENMAALSAKFKLNEDIFRAQIVKSEKRAAAVE